MFLTEKAFIVITQMEFLWQTLLIFVVIKFTKRTGMQHIGSIIHLISANTLKHQVPLKLVICISIVKKGRISTPLGKLIAPKTEPPKQI